MNVAKLAEFLRADNGDVAHIYDDGLVLAVACSTERHGKLREFLAQHYDVLDARSRDGFSAVFVLRFLSLGTTALEDLPPIIGITTHYADQRQDDWHTLTDAEELAERYAEIIPGKIKE